MTESVNISDIAIAPPLSLVTDQLVNNDCYVCGFIGSGQSTGKQELSLSCRAGCSGAMLTVSAGTTEAVV